MLICFCFKSSQITSKDLFLFIVIEIAGSISASNKYFCMTYKYLFRVGLFEYVSL